MIKKNMKDFFCLLDPDFPLECYYGPYRSLAIRAYHFPLDTRLNWTHVGNLLSAGNITARRLVTDQQYADEAKGWCGG
jgi:hypothetical protein